MEPSNNITNYKQKYLKYKIKYLKLKGGMPTKTPTASDSSSSIRSRNQSTGPHTTGYSSTAAPAPTATASTPPHATGSSSSSTWTRNQSLPHSSSIRSRNQSLHQSSSFRSRNQSQHPSNTAPTHTPTTTSSKPHSAPATDSSASNWPRNIPLPQPNEVVPHSENCNDTHGIYKDEYFYNTKFNIIITSHVLKHIKSFGKNCIEDIDDETEKENLKNFVVSLVNDAISKGKYNDELNNKGMYTYVNTNYQYCIVGEWIKNKWDKDLYRVYTIYKCSGRYLTPDYK